MENTKIEKQINKVLEKIGWHECIFEKEVKK